MGLNTKKRLFLFKSEGSYGTDPTPTGTDNAIQCRNLVSVPIEADVVQRDNVRPYLGNAKQLVAQARSKVEFEIELQGSGIPGVAPAWGAILKACGFAETAQTVAVTISSSGTTATVTETGHGRTDGSKIKIAGATETEYNVEGKTITVIDANSYSYVMDADPTGSSATGSPVAYTGVKYDPVSSSFGSGTGYFYLDGMRQKKLGMRGTVSFSINAQEIPVMKVSLTGIYNTPTDTAFASAVFTGFKVPKVPNSTNSPAFSIFGYSAALQSFSLDMANQIEHRDLIGGSEKVEIVDRKPSGSVVIELPTIAGKDLFSEIIAANEGAISLTHGITSGYKVTMSIPTAILGSPTLSDEKGIAMLNLPFVPQPSDSGNDEVRITVA